MTICTRKCRSSIRRLAVTAAIVLSALLIVATQAATPQTADAASTSPTITSAAQCITGGVPGVTQAVRPGRLTVTGGTGAFAGVSSHMLSLTITPGGTLSGQVDLLADNTGQSFDIAPLIATPSWGNPATSYRTVDSSIPTGTGTYIASMNVIAPTRPGTYHLLFAFALEEHGYNVASATNWAAGVPPQWGDGSNIAQFNAIQVLDAQRYGCAVERWIMQTGPQEVLVAVSAITVNVASSALPASPSTANNPSGIAGASWHTMSTNGISQTGTQLDAVTCASNTDCWAVGGVSTGPTATSGEGPATTLAIHWDGTSWSRAATPSPVYGNGTEDVLDAIACPASNDCWAGGWQGAGAGTNGVGLLLHWNGYKWAVAELASLMQRAGAIVSVACVSASECWAAGEGRSPSDGPLYQTGPVASLLRYGKLKGRLAWRPAADTHQLPTTAVIRDLGCAPQSSQCWMVGTIPVAGYPGGGKQPSADTFAASYVPGRGWTQTPTPSPPSDSAGPVDQLTSVTCTIATSCWAVGDNPSDAANLSGAGANVLAYHWNGHTWSSAPTPAPSAALSAGFEPRSVACLTSSDCWLVGSEGVDLGEGAAGPLPQYRAMAMEWNGDTWSEIPLAQSSSTDVHLGAVACASETCFAVGYYTGAFVQGTAGAATHPLILRLSGASAPAPASALAAGGVVSRLVFSPSPLSSPTGTSFTQSVTLTTETCAGTAVPDAPVILSLHQKAPYSIPYGSATVDGSTLQDGIPTQVFTTGPNGTVTITYRTPPEITHGRLDELTAEIPGDAGPVLRSRDVVGDSSTLAITTGSLPCAEHRGHYRTALHATGGTGGFAWSLADRGTLPSGITLSSSGVLEGVPNDFGPAWFIAKVTDGAGKSTTATLWLAIGSGPTILSQLPAGEAGVPYNARLALAPASCSGIGPQYAAYQPCGGTAPYTFSVVSGSLPPGVSLARDGRLTGTPTEPGSFTSTVWVTDAIGSHTSALVTIAIGPLITYLNRRQGPTIGGTTVTAEGIGLGNVTDVAFVTAHGLTSTVACSSSSVSCTVGTTSTGLSKLTLTTPAAPGTVPSGGSVATWVEAFDGSYGSPGNASMCAYSTPPGGLACDQFLFQAPIESSSNCATASPGTATLGGGLTLASTAARSTVEDTPDGSQVDASPASGFADTGSSSPTTTVSGSGALSVNGSLSLTPSVHACVTISGFHLQSFKLSGSLNLSGSLGLTSTGTVSVDASDTLGLPLDLPAFPISPGVLVFPTASLQLQASGSVGGSFTVAARESVTTSLGVQYAKGNWSLPEDVSCGGTEIVANSNPTDAPLTDCFPVPMVSLSASASLSVKAFLRITFLVEDLAGPYLQIGPGLSLHEKAAISTSSTKFDHCGEASTIPAGGGSAALLCASLDAGIGISANPILGIAALSSSPLPLVSVVLWQEGISTPSATDPSVSAGGLSVSALGKGQLSLVDLSGPPAGVAGFGDPRYFQVDAAPGSTFRSLQLTLREPTGTHRLYWWSRGAWRPIGPARTGMLRVAIESGANRGGPLPSDALFDVVHASPQNTAPLILVAGALAAAALMVMILAIAIRRRRHAQSVE